MATTDLSWAALPRLAPGICDTLYDERLEERVRYDSEHRKAKALWFQHMLRLKFVTLSEIAKAMSAPFPFTALQRLYVRTQGAIAGHLNTVLARHAGRVAHQRDCPSISLNLAPAASDGTPTVSLTLDEEHPFLLSSLHNVPRRLAALVHESLSLLSYCLHPFLLPADLWKGDVNFCFEEGQDEFEAMKEAGVLHDLELAAQWIEQKGNGFYFGGPAENLREQLKIFRARRFHRPAWMHYSKSESKREDKGALKRASRLDQAAAQYIIEYGSHPWAKYAQTVCDFLREHFADEAAIARWHKSKHRWLDEYDEGDTALYVGLCAVSGTHLEYYNIQEQQNLRYQGGEQLNLRVLLTGLASTRLLGILEATATCVGLLLRANAVNNEVEKRKYERRTKRI